MCRSFGGAVCAGVVTVICSSAQGQNLFEADFNSGSINEYTPGGTQSTFASGLNGPSGVAFDSSGDLFVATLNAATFTKLLRAGRKVLLPLDCLLLGGWPSTTQGIYLRRITAAATFTNLHRVGCKVRSLLG